MWGNNLNNVIKEIIVIKFNNNHSKRSNKIVEVVHDRST